MSRIFALGSNGSGQLGLGHKDDMTSPHEVRLPDNIPGGIAELASGGNHTVFRTSAGHVYGCGSSSGGQLGIEAQESLVPTPLPLPHVRLLAAAWACSYFVTDDGDLLVCGSGEKGELGLGEDVRSVTKPRQVPLGPFEGKSITAIRASMGHVVVLTSNNGLYGWGNGRSGQLGTPSSIVWSPRRIENVPFVPRSIACGKEFTCIFSSHATGEIFLLGLDRSDRFKLKTTKPSRVAGFVEAVASWGSLYILTGTRSLLRYGRNDHGQLGPETLPSIARIAAGSEHVVAVTAEGQVITWGWGEHGNCGLPVDVQKDVKEGFNNTLDVPGTVRWVHAGCATTLIGIDDGLS